MFNFNKKPSDVNRDSIFTLTASINFPPETTRPPFQATIPTFAVLNEFLSQTLLLD